MTTGRMFRSWEGKGQERKEREEVCKNSESKLDQARIKAVKGRGKGEGKWSA